MSWLFRDRAEAGERLADALAAYAVSPELLVLALPRGGVPVGDRVAEKLGAELDVMLVRKLGVPGHEELAMGALALGGARIVNEDVVRGLGISDATIDKATARAHVELERRNALYRGGATPPRVRGRTVLLVDDGLATGSTMRAAVAALRPLGASHIVVAVPVAPPATLALVSREADGGVCVATREPFSAVGLWYGDFTQVTDDEVRAIIETARARYASRSR